jgi:uncharacterized protein
MCISTYGVALNEIFVLFFLSLFMSVTWAAETTQSGISLDKPWKVAIYQFSKDNLQHSAWGVGHYERNYLLVKKIAKLENITIDEDVLFAAAFLHDIGVFEPYVIEGAEHSKTASDNIESILRPSGFPMTKIEEVNASIMSHMFYAQVSESPIAKIFHDADTLDFLGNIGITRILSLTTRHRWATNLTTAIATIEKFNRELPEKLIFESSKEIANKRVKETELFIQSLNVSSKGGSAL